MADSERSPAAARHPMRRLLDRTARCWPPTSSSYNLPPTRVAPRTLAISCRDRLAAVRMCPSAKLEQRSGANAVAAYALSNPLPTTQQRPCAAFKEQEPPSTRQTRRRLPAFPPEGTGVPISRLQPAASTRRNTFPPGPRGYRVSGPIAAAAGAGFESTSW